MTLRTRLTDRVRQWLDGSRGASGNPFPVGLQKWRDLDLGSRLDDLASLGESDPGQGGDLVGLDPDGYDDLEGKSLGAAVRYVWSQVLVITGGDGLDASDVPRGVSDVDADLTAVEAAAAAAQSSADAAQSAADDAQGAADDAQTDATSALANAATAQSAANAAQADATSALANAASALGHLRSDFSLITQTLTLGTTQPLSLADSLFTGRVAGGSAPVSGTSGVVGVVAASFASSGAETGTSAGQAGLGAAATADRPYPIADFPGQRYRVCMLLRADGSPVRLVDMLSTSVTDALAEVRGRLSYRSDLGANAKWRLHFYYNRSSDGVEVPLPSINVSLTNCQLFVPEVFTSANEPVGAGLGDIAAAPLVAGAVAATDTLSGVVELATTAEVNTGTDAVRAVTPATLAATSLVFHPAVAAEYNGLASATPADADVLPFEDASAGTAYSKVKATLAVLAAYVLGYIHSLAAKTPVAADEVVVTDSAASFAPKSVPLSAVATLMQAAAVTVSEQTSDSTLNATTDMGKSFNNKSTSALVSKTLPTCAAGLHYKLRVMDTDGIRLVANTGDVIRAYDLVSISAGYIQSVVIGATLDVEGQDDTTWLVVGGQGVWSVQTS